MNNVDGTTNRIMIIANYKLVCERAYVSGLCSSLWHSHGQQFSYSVTYEALRGRTAGRGAVRDRNVAARVRVGPSQPEVMVVNCSSGHIDGRQETGPYKPDELVY